MSAKLIQVIFVDDVLVGCGRDDDPWRRISQYWTTNGELIHEIDLWREEQQQKINEEAAVRLFMEPPTPA